MYLLSCIAPFRVWDALGSSLLPGAFLFVLGLRVRGGSVLSARSVAVPAILSAYCLAFLVGFRLTSALTFPDIAL